MGSVRRARCGVLVNDKGQLGDGTTDDDSCRSGHRFWRDRVHRVVTIAPVETHLRRQERRHRVVLGPQRQRPTRRQHHRPNRTTPVQSRPRRHRNPHRRHRDHRRRNTPALSRPTHRLVLGPQRQRPTRRQHHHPLVQPRPGQGPGGTGTLTNAINDRRRCSTTCAVKTDGTVWCWGRNDRGQLGNNTTTDHLTPVQVQGPGGTGTLTAVTAITAGQNTPAPSRPTAPSGAGATTTKANSATTPPPNHPPPSRSTAPAAPAPSATPPTLAAGATHLRRQDRRTAWCWGLNDKGQLGDNTTTDTTAPVQVQGPGGTGTLTNVIPIGAGRQPHLRRQHQHTPSGAGASTTKANSATTPPPTAPPPSKSSASAESTPVRGGCGGDGLVWGQRGGRGVVLGPQRQVSWVMAPDDHLCRSGHRLWRVGILSAAVSIARCKHTCVVKPTPPCGVGASTQANSATTPPPSPAPSSPRRRRHRTLTTSPHHRRSTPCAVKPTPPSGARASTTKANSATTPPPTRPAPSSPRTGGPDPHQRRHIAAGLKHTCVVKTDATIWCWGLNTRANSATTPPPPPPPSKSSDPAAPDPHHRQSITAGLQHTCAVKTDATIWCWGLNDKGQLGDNTTTDSPPPSKSRTRRPDPHQRPNAAAFPNTPASSRPTPPSGVGASTQRPTRRQHHHRPTHPHPSPRTGGPDPHQLIPIGPALPHLRRPQPTPSTAGASTTTANSATTPPPPLTPIQVLGTFPSSCFCLLHRHTLGEVSGLVDIVATEAGYVVCQ